MDNGFFIPLGFELVDAGIVPVVGHKLVWVYIGLRRFVWRKTIGGDPEVVKLVNAGYLVAKVKQRTVAELTGQSRESVNRQIHRMKQLGWLRVVELRTGGVAAYELGRTRRTSSGREEEFYIDAWLRRVWDALEAEASKDALLGDINGTGRQRSRKRKATPTAGDRLALVAKLSPERRQHIVRGFLQADRARAEGGRLRGGGDANATTAVTRATQVPVLISARGCDKAVTVEEDSKGEAANGGKKIDRGCCAWRTNAPPLSSSPGSPPGTKTRRGRQPADHESPQGAPRKIAVEETSHAGCQDWKETDDSAPHLPDCDWGEQRDVEIRDDELKRCEAIWLGAMRDRWPDVTFTSWGGKERGQCGDLLEKYRVGIVERALTYVVREWDQINDRFLHGKGSFPCVGLVLKLHDVLVLEAQTLAEPFAALRELEDWYDAHPDEPCPPELERRKQEAEAALDSMGIKFRPWHDAE